MCVHIHIHTYMYMYIGICSPIIVLRILPAARISQSLSFRLVMKGKTPLSFTLPGFHWLNSTEFHSAWVPLWLNSTGFHSAWVPLYLHSTEHENRISLSFSYRLFEGQNSIEFQSAWVPLAEFH